MAITQTLTNSFKGELIQGLHNFAASGGDVFKIALYTSSATLDATTTVYSATNEVSGTGYTAGGLTLTNNGVTTSGTTSYLDFADATFTSATITASGAMIYNSTNGNRAVCILNFGGSYSSTASNFTIVFPAPGTSTALIILN